MRRGILNTETARAKSGDHFPTRKTRESVRAILLQSDQIDKIKRDLGWVCEIKQRAWKIMSGVQIGGKIRECRDRDQGDSVKFFNRSAFELRPGPVRDLLNVGDTRIFGAVDYSTSCQSRWVCSG